MRSDTTWMELGHPTPRRNAIVYDEQAWRVSETRPLREPSEERPWAFLVGGRASRRTFGPMPRDCLAELLWHVGACRRSASSPMGFPIERRGVPSAGAIHPIHILIGDPRTGVLERYDGQCHALQELTTPLPRDLLAACANVLPPQEGLLLLFVAEPGKTAAKYECSDSLVWRDAGVLQGALALVAEGLDLNFCLLGMTGEPWLSRLSEEGKLQGVGLALIGSRP